MLKLITVVAVMAACAIAAPLTVPAESRALLDGEWSFFIINLSRPLAGFTSGSLLALSYESLIA